MVPFAGPALPLDYPTGVDVEHRHCRHSAALFDISHTGQLRVSGGDAGAALESLVPIDLLGLEPGRQRYAFFTDAGGGILDDLKISRRCIDGIDDFLLTVNGSRQAADTRHLVTQIGHRCTVETIADRAFLALQGPKAVQALARLDAEVAALAFMGGGSFTLAGADCFVTRSGYTGEDGFEISVPIKAADALARALLALPDVLPAGLGARDTLRLEAGLCLVGQDIDETTTPVQAGLAWVIPAVRRQGGERHGGYPGADAIDAQLAHGVRLKRVGLIGLERIPVQAGVVLVDAQGHKLGHATSGMLAPTVEAPVVMAYLAANHALLHHEVYAEIEDRLLPMRVCSLPFVAHRYFRHPALATA